MCHLFQTHHINWRDTLHVDLQTNMGEPPIGTGHHWWMFKAGELFQGCSQHPRFKNQIKLLDKELL